MLNWRADFVDNQIEENRKVIIGRFGKAYSAGWKFWSETRHKVLYF